MAAGKETMRGQGTFEYHGRPGGRVPRERPAPRPLKSVRKQRGQGTFEYILLLGGALLVTTLSLFVLLNSPPTIEQDKQCALAARQSLECFKPGGGFNDAASFNYQDRTTPCTCTSV
ncbi:class III signal peptide-containing protein, partial [Candidatus Micrarchaeota archaeon]|nr:class III signal peptide-containing protein [Candidatus Micrarchaeota archaeon]